MKRIFSGIQPSGNLHIGNYVGAISQWVEMQNTSDALFCIVDLHAITVEQDPAKLREKILEVAALYIACGVDPEKAKIFVQSENSDHTTLAWMLNCITPFGQLERMTQFKDKALKQKEKTTAGLFDYPVLMAADILLYETDEVPVGEDQKQHLELARDVAERFNSKFGLVFKVPEPRILQTKARIMSLQDPDSKMSKSDDNMQATIFLLDPLDQVEKKIMRAVTDSERGINAEKMRELVNSNKTNGTLNLLEIYSVVTGVELGKVLSEKDGMQYGEFKKDLVEKMNVFLKPIQEKYFQIRKDEGYLSKVLDAGRDYACVASAPVLFRARNTMGLGRD